MRYGDVTYLYLEQYVKKLNNFLIEKRAIHQKQKNMSDLKNIKGFLEIVHQSLLLGHV